jgi:hypothetical protein
MRLRAASRPTRAQAALQALEGPLELAVHVGLAAVHHLSLGHDDEVAVDGSSRWEDATPERLPEQSLRAIALDRAADSAADGEAETVMGLLVGHGGEIEEAAVHADAAPQDLCVVRTLGEPFRGPEVLVRTRLHEPPWSPRRRCGDGPSDVSS